jgi:hypothetical protein
MPRVLLDGDLDHLVTPTHSDARGPVVRGKSIEMMKMHWRAGDSARPHQHPEAQAISFKNIVAPFYAATKTL